MAKKERKGMRMDEESAGRGGGEGEAGVRSCWGSMAVERFRYSSH